MKRKLGILASLGFFAIVLVSTQAMAQTQPTLTAVASYSVLAGSIVTNTGPTTVAGDLGVSPSIGVPPHVTGFLPGVVGPPGTIHDADVPAGFAQADNTAVFLNAVSGLDQPCNTNYPGGQDLTLVSPLGPGVYCSPTSFLLTGNLTLSGTGVWIFKAGSTLITSPGSSVTGADPCSVWWRVGSSATLDTTTSFIGTIIALTDINLNTGATLNGRALAQTGQVVLQSNIIGGPVCAGAGGGGGTGGDTTPAPTPAPVPTLPGWAILMLTALLALAGFAAMRRRAL